MIAVWGVSFLNTRVLLNAGLNPTEIFVARFTIAYIALLACSGFKLSYNGLKDEFLFLIGGFMGGSAYFIAENTAIKLTLISDVSIIVCIAPLLTALLGAIFYRDERITPLMGLGMVIAFVGSTILALREGLAWGDSLLGDLLAMLAALVWAIYCMVLKQLNNRYTTLFITRKTFFYGLVTALPFLTLEPSQINWAMIKDPAVWGNLIYLGLICSMAAFFIWNITVKRIGAVRTSNYIYWSPVISIIAAAIWFGEHPTLIDFLGCALIMAGVIIAEKFKRK